MLQIVMDPSYEIIGNNRLIAASIYENLLKKTKSKQSRMTGNQRD